MPASSIGSNVPCPEKGAHLRSFFAFPSDSLWYPETEYGIMATTYSETAHLKGDLTYGTHQSGLRRNGRRAGRSVEGIFLLRSHFCGCSGSQGADSPSAVNALDQEAPEGYVYVSVETGVSDDSYIEITSGLQDGDTVAYLRAASGSSDFMMGGIPGGDMGGQGGGMPGGGGMTSGGPSGGRGGV